MHVAKGPQTLKKNMLSLKFWLVFYHTKHHRMVTTCAEALCKLQVVSQQAMPTKFKELHFHH